MDDPVNGVIYPPRILPRLFWGVSGQFMSVLLLAGSQGINWIFNWANYDNVNPG